MLPDIHTHNINADNRYSILNSPTYIPGRNISMGIHPWDITEDWKNRFESIGQDARNENVKAIGECGIDKINATAGIETQKKIFHAHAMLAEEVKKPLIIHCVKGHDEILSIYKEIKPRQAWIIHGFRGKPEQAGQLTKAGLYLSFGDKFNKESIAATPVGRLFIESDESIISIADIYRSIAHEKGCIIEELAQSIQENLEKCNIVL